MLCVSSQLCLDRATRVALAKEGSAWALSGLASRVSLGDAGLLHRVGLQGARRAL